ncbi:hypothetical protein J5N97_025477 [Dioscorea zingiberensis]|uniref:Uncharacterized protein n=1 Tax=Dioscorea zingiberensis TaxID=325984 RepID=A0A9D5C9W3_9LILI|nr:hypothetical protein J5N97_025477 [Dioscorea zingiberensis]
MGGCASKPKDLNAENPDLVPAENPTTTTPEPTVNPVEPETTPTPEEVTAEVPKEKSEEKKEMAKPEEGGVTVKEEVKGGLVVESCNKVKEGGEDLSPKESETKKTDKDQEPTTTTTTTTPAPAAAVESALTQNKVEEVKPETKSVEEKPREQN